MTDRPDGLTAKAIVDLGDLALRLSRVERITFHPDGKRPETDSDHTVMLGLIAPAFAARYLPELDLGLVAQFALVHDLPEAYAGDTPTLKLNGDDLAQKKERELAATERIVKELGQDLPWLVHMLTRYEHQHEPEARYVRAMDKLLPKVTHILNQGRTFTTVQGEMSFGDLVRRYQRQLRELEEYAADFPPLFDLRAQLLTLLYPAVFGTLMPKEVGV